MVKSKAFQLTIEEACAASDMVRSMYLFFMYFFILICLLLFMCFILGSFLLNDIYALVLFESGAT